MNLWRKPVWQEYDGGVVTAHSSANLSDHPGRKVIRCPMETATRRLEERVSLTIRVNLYSLDTRKRAQEGITENVSTHGVRVVSGKPLKLNERLNLRSLPGDLRARARVVYAKPPAFFTRKKPIRQSPISMRRTGKRSWVSYPA